jgi:hypothetical protein
MAKVAIGGTDGIIDRLIKRMGWEYTTDITRNERKDALVAINEAEQHIAQAESLRHLSVYDSTTLNLVIAATNVALPSNLDLGKDITIENPNGGVLEYLPPDEFAAITASRGNSFALTPSYYTIRYILSVPEFRFYFKPLPATNVILSIDYQRIPPALTDASNSFSTLPEGYELTLLLERAEAELKRQLRRPGWEEATTISNDRLQRFYSQFRSSKEKPTSDEGQARRKNARTQLAEGT